MNKDKFQLAIIDSAAEFETVCDHFNNVNRLFPNLEFKDHKRITLRVIEVLMQKDVIWPNYYDFKPWPLSIDMSINKISDDWSEQSTYPELLDIVWFKWTDWFHDLLKSKDYDFLSNWRQYVENNKWLGEILDTTNTKFEI